MKKFNDFCAKAIMMGVLMAILILGAFVYRDNPDGSVRLICIANEVFCFLGMFWLAMSKEGRRQ